MRSVIKKLKGSSQKVRRSQVLLKADADGAGWTDVRIAEAFDCRTKTVENIRQRLVRDGFEIALNGKQRESPPRAKLLDGEQEAKLIAMRLGSPQGLRQLDAPAARTKSCATGDRGFHQSGNRPQDPKKNDSTQRKIQYWVIPPAADSEFVACMEDVLETYKKPCDKRFPVLCMDEQPGSCSRKPGFPFRPRRNMRAAWTTNTNATGRPASSCSPSP